MPLLTKTDLHVFKNYKQPDRPPSFLADELEEEKEYPEPKFQPSQIMKILKEIKRKNRRSMLHNREPILLSDSSSPILSRGKPRRSTPPPQHALSHSSSDEDITDLTEDITDLTEEPEVVHMVSSPPTNISPQLKPLHQPQPSNVQTIPIQPRPQRPKPMPAPLFQPFPTMQTTKPQPPSFQPFHQLFQPFPTQPQPPPQPPQPQSPPQPQPASSFHSSQQPPSPQQPQPIPKASSQTMEPPQPPQSLQPPQPPPAIEPPKPKIIRLFGRDVVTK